MQQKYQHYCLIKLINAYLAGEEILPFHQSRVTEQVKFTYSPLRKALEKQIKTAENHGKNQIKAIYEHVKQLAKSNAFIKKDDDDTEKFSSSFSKRKKYLMKGAMKY